MLFLQTNNATQALTLFELIWKGGIVLIPIIILLLISIYLFIERYLAYRQMAKIDTRLIESIKIDLAAGELKQAIHTCESQQGAMPMILHSGLKAMSTGSSIDEIEKSMESMANLVFSRITTPLSLLGLISGIAPMLGFVGTILGIIRIFYNISLSDNISIGIIAGGLYEKMITSFAGLVVGIVAYSAYHWINFLIERLALRIETETFQFLNFLKEPTK